jgi:hypothetical protein
MAHDVLLDLAPRGRVGTSSPTLRRLLDDDSSAENNGQAIWTLLIFKLALHRFTTV